MYVFDGEFHVLDETWAYSGLKVDESLLAFEFSDFTDTYLKKYAEYLYEFDKEQVLDIIISQFKSRPFSENVQFIFTPAFNGTLNQSATFVMKFKRVENDNLDGK